MISGRRFRFGANGVAFIGGVCGSTRFGMMVVSGETRPPVYVAVTLAHELGHTLGMLHDDDQRGKE